MLGGEFLNQMAQILGIKQDDENLVKLQQIKELATINVPDTWGAGMKGLLSQEAARNNPELRDHWFGIFANGMDASLEQAMSEHGIDAETALEIKGQKKINQKFIKLVETVKAKEAQKATATPADKDKLAGEIAGLNKQIKDLVEDKQKAINEVNSTWHEKLKQLEMEKTYSDFQYGVDLPKDVLLSTTDTLVKKHLAEKKYKVVYDPEKNSIGLKTESDTDVFENNTPVNFKDLATRIVSENKLLKTTGAAPAAQPAASNGQYTGAANKGGINTSAFDAAVAELQSQIQN